MPLYEYACRPCGTSFERRRKFAERLERAHCPQCGSPAEPVLSAPALVGATSDSRSCATPAGGFCCGGGTCAPN